MSSIMQGNPSNVTVDLAATITNATNASPIVITTSAAHGFANGDRVQIANVAGNTAANGLFFITVVDSTHFFLNGSTGNGAYTSGGTVWDLYLTPPFLVPGDGDALNVASILAALQALADRSQKNRAGAAPYKVLNAGGAAGGTLGVNNTWTSPWQISSNLGLATISGLRADDVVEMEAWSGFVLSAAATGGARIGVSENASSYTDGSATWQDAGQGFGEQNFGDPGATAASVVWPVHMAACWIVLANAPSTVRFVIQANPGAAANIIIPSGVKFGYRYRTFRAIL